MQCRLWILGIVLVAGCSGSGNNTDGGTTTDMTVKPDLASCVGTGALSVGDVCKKVTAKSCECSGVHAACISDYTVGTNDITLPDNTCTNTACDTTNSLDTCGDNGACVNLFGMSDPLCFQKCTKGKCRDGYKCIGFQVDTNIAKTANICVPPDQFGIDCDPTKPQNTQCTMVGGMLTSTLTNGNPNAGCRRVGLDDVGQCSFLPCNIGPKNCPGTAAAPYGCFYATTTDGFKGTICLGVNPTQKKVGDTCDSATNGRFDCGDNLSCINNVCLQNCYAGTQPTFMAAGNPMYKNAATPCPGATKCTDFAMLGGANYPGVCM